MIPDHVTLEIGLVSAADPRGEGGDRPPLDWGQKKFHSAT